MPSANTSLGGPAEGFPDTEWGLVSRLRDPAGGRYRAGLEALCNRYWKPVYVYLRAAWAKTNEDAKDLTQAFFLWLIEGDALRRFQPERGGFRRYLRVVLRSFVGHHETALQALKRGGRAQLVSLEGSTPSMEDVVADPKSVGPEEAFQRVWVVEVVKQAIERVRQRRLSGGDALSWHVYEEYALAPNAQRPTYVQLAARLGLKENDVNARLVAIRREIRAEIRSELARLTSDPQEVEEEWNELFRG
jgi:RNA polymerase sigma-70 factor (ECF subfamily)